MEVREINKSPHLYFVSRPSNRLFIDLMTRVHADRARCGGGGGDGKEGEEGEEKSGDERVPRFGDEIYC